ncbi:MAG: hypothetical protein M1546_09120 [Chloroflexi bacterium]|nr:hypothetical protein [Chloroflexota bacterium]
MSGVTYEQVIERVKALPLDKLPSVYDFVGYLAAQTESGAVPPWLNASEAQMRAEDEVWDAILAADPDKLRRLAERAAEAYRAGQTSGINSDGDELTPTE